MEWFARNICSLLCENHWRMHAAHSKGQITWAYPRLQFICTVYVMQTSYDIETSNKWLFSEKFKHSLLNGQFWLGFASVIAAVIYMYLYKRIISRLSRKQMAVILHNTFRNSFFFKDVQYMPLSSLYSTTVIIMSHQWNNNILYKTNTFLQK